MHEIDRIRRRPFAEQAPGPGGGPYRGVTQAPEMPPPPRKVEATMNEERDRRAHQIPAKPSTAITHVL